MFNVLFTKNLKTYTNCVCEFKKPKSIHKNYHIQNVTFKTQSSKFLNILIISNV